MARMRRKLIQHGASSLTVSLPRKWVKENNLKKGNEIEVDELESKIIISTQKQYGSKKIELDVSGAQPMVRKMLGAAFKSGYDEICVSFSSHDELKAVQELAREQFTGFEIIRQTKSSITIKNLSQNRFEEFDNVLKRLFFIINQMASETCDAAGKNDFEWLKNISLLKIESDKAADYCRRAVNMGCESSFKRNAPLYTVIEQVEKSADRYSELCSYVSSNKIKVSGKTLSFIKKLAAFQNEFYGLVFKFETKNMVKFGRSKEQLQRELDAIAQTCSKKEIKIITLLDRILNLIFDLNGPLMASRI